MNTNKAIFITICFSLFAITAVAQTRFMLNNCTETVLNNAVIYATGLNGSELKFEMDTNHAYIKWQAINESNTSHFEMQISDDNKVFTTLKKVAASDITQWATNYQAAFRKTYLSSKKVYYRIKTVFSDGAEKYTSSTSFETSDGRSISYISIH